MKYEVQFIKDQEGEKGNYRITHIPSASRVATSYSKENADIVCSALNASSKETELDNLVNVEDKLDDVLSKIRKEFIRAKTLFPAKFVNQHEAYAVILEEIDELWDEIKKNQKNYDFDAQRKEATQAAAMIVRMLVELL